MPRLVVPGTLLGSASTYTAGENIYERNGSLYSSVLGTLHTSTNTENGSQLMSVETGNPKLPYVGCTVLAQIVKITRKRADCNIICVDGRPLGQVQKGILVPNNIHESKTLDTTLYEWFKPGDTIRAQVQMVRVLHPK
ncbi:bifunctional Exosome complex component [Babesia duncani]|uniref:Bifunctional Exosome complex component n=1 Tax=Babesia duncani TaxID=323732 RepID=A0AAD9PM49_9APIC|nr:bifunctional Exosome complex component [Babesia duncani]